MDGPNSISFLFAPIRGFREVRKNCPSAELAKLVFLSASVMDILLVRPVLEFGERSLPPLFLRIASKSFEKSQ